MRKGFASLLMVRPSLIRIYSDRVSGTVAEGNAHGRESYTPAGTGTRPEAQSATGLLMAHGLRHRPLQAGPHSACPTSGDQLRSLPHCPPATVRRTLYPNISYQ